MITYRMIELTVQSCLCNIAHGMLDSPDDAVDEELELRRWNAQQSREAVEVDCPKKLEEAHTVLRILSEVLVNHAQRWLEDSVEDGGDLRSEQRLSRR